MPVLLDKTHHQYYRKCPCYGWHMYNKKLPENTTDFQEYLFEEGNKVETLAQNLHPGGWKVDNKNRQKDADQTRQLIEDAKQDVEIIYQASALSESQLLAKADIVKVSDRPKKRLRLYEIKMASNIGLGEKKDLKKQAKYLSDVAFQKIAFEKAGYRVEKAFIVHINPDYQLLEEIIDPRKLFKTVDVSAEIAGLGPEIEAEIKQAQACYASEKPPKCPCRLKPKTDRCPYFEEFNPDIPTKNSVFDLTRVSVPKLELLLSKKVLRIEDISFDDFLELKFSPKQAKQIEVTQSQETWIEEAAIEEMLASLKFPLYFLDYETISYAVPVFYGSQPNRHIPFQFSLHVLDKQGRLKHCEHLMPEASNQALENLLADLQRNIGPAGSVVVWHQGAEKTFHRNLAQLLPGSAKFLENLSQRFFDLEQIFTRQLYLDPDFEGRTSLKKVLPVLVPRLSYENLDDIQEGQQASIAWNKALEATPKERQRTFESLLKYCKHDTLAMVEIYKFLKEKIA